MARKPLKTSSRWFLPTNTANVRIMLAQGLITCHDGFLEKYYQDLLVLCPGRIPLFRNEVDEQSFSWVTSEAEHLQGCLLELDLQMLDLPAHIKVFKQEQWQDMPFGEAIEADSRLIALPAPLPLTLIKKILFETPEQMQEFKKDCEMRGNIELDNKLLSATKKDAGLFQFDNINLFKNEHQNTATNPEISTLPAPFVAVNTWQPVSVEAAGYQATYAWGGMLALLFYMAKNGRVSHDFFTLLSDGSITELENNYEELSSLLAFLYKPVTDQPLSERELIDCEISRTVTHADNVKDGLLAFLKDHVWQDEKVKGRALQLFQTLQQFDSGSDIHKKPSDYFSKETFLGKNLLMLFYRESSRDWLSEDRTLPCEFNEQQLLGFAILFGLRDKFTGVAPFLRKYQNLQNHMSVLMARFAHNKLASPMVFINPPKKPETIWSLLQKKTSRKKVVTQLRLQSSVSTVILARQFKFESAKIIVPGIIEPDYHIDEAHYYQEMQHKVVDDIAYNKLSR